MDLKNNEEGSKENINQKVNSKSILGKVIVSKSGKRFGELSDFIFDTETGEIIELTIENPTSLIKDINLEKDSDGDYLIPFHSVIAIGDFVVVSEEDIV